MSSVLHIIAGKNATWTVSALRAYLVSQSLLCRGCKCVLCWRTRSEAPHMALKWIMQLIQPSVFWSEEIIFVGPCGYWM